MTDGALISAGARTQEVILLCHHAKQSTLRQAEVAPKCVRIRKEHGSQNVADSNNKPADRTFTRNLQNEFGSDCHPPTTTSRTRLVTAFSVQTQLTHRVTHPQSMPRHSELVHDMSQSRTQFLIAVLAGSVGSVP